MSLIKEFISIFVKNPIVAIQLFFLFVKYKFIKNQNDWTFYYHGHKLVYPAWVWYGVIWSIQEIFVNKYYKNLKWLNNILDLGGYFGESAIYLSEQNNNVDVYEADPDIYTYMSQNTSNISNIKSYNIAVVNNDTKELYFDNLWWWFTMSGFITTQKTDKIVKCEHIKNIISQKDYDGIKIDIEWSEYGIVDWINQEYDWWLFKKWYIEFHYFDDNQISKTPIMIKCIQLLIQKFQVNIYNAQNWKEIILPLQELEYNIKNKKLSVIFLSFL